MYPPENTPKKLHTGEKVIIFLLVLIFGSAVLVSGAFLLMNKQYWEFSVSTMGFTSQQNVEKKDNRPTEKTSELIEWENTQQTYSISYPPTWNLYPNSIGASVGSFSGTIISTVKPQSALGEVPTAGEGRVTITIVDNKKPTENALSPYLKNSTLLSARNKTLLDTEKVGENVAMVFSPSAGSATYFLDKGGTVYSIETISTNAKQKEDIKKIINSFRFTIPDLVDTTGWKKYENKDLGYSFSYPQNYVVRDRGNIVSIMQSDIVFMEIEAPVVTTEDYCKVRPIRSTIELNFEFNGSSMFVACDPYAIAFIQTEKMKAENIKGQLPLKLIYVDTKGLVDIQRTILSTLVY